MSAKTFFVVLDGQIYDYIQHNGFFHDDENGRYYLALMSPHNRRAYMPSVDRSGKTYNPLADYDPYQDIWVCEEDMEFTEKVYAEWQRLIRLQERIDNWGKS